MVLVACHLLIVAVGGWAAAVHVPLAHQAPELGCLVSDTHLPFDRQALFQHLLQLRGHAGDHEALCGVPRGRTRTAGRSLTVPSGVGASCRGSLCLLGCHLPAPWVVAAWRLCPACGSFQTVPKPVADDWPRVGGLQVGGISLPISGSPAALAQPLCSEQVP